MGKLIGSSLDAKVYLHTSDESLASRLRALCRSDNDADELSRIFITSQVEVLSRFDNELIQSIPHTGEYLIEESSKIWIGVSRADGLKCERCWNYTPEVGSFMDHPTLCNHCYKVVAIQPEPTIPEGDNLKKTIRQFQAIQFRVIHPKLRINVSNRLSLIWRE